jgi:hypothetical protein
MANLGRGYPGGPGTRDTVVSRTHGPSSSRNGRVPGICGAGNDSEPRYAIVVSKRIHDLSLSFCRTRRKLFPQRAGSTHGRILIVPLSVLLLCVGCHASSMASHRHVPRSLSGGFGSSSRSSMGHAPVIGCEHHISQGTGQQEPDAGKSSLHAGPVTFVGLGKVQPREVVSLSKGHYRSIKRAISFRGSSPIKIVIPKRYRTYLSLLYDPSSWNSTDSYKVRNGDSAEKFLPCGGALTGYAGGFIVAGRHCAKLKIYVGKTSKPKRLNVSFGLGARCAN